jgi:glycosyltransferase involved in cell wall biosynthesis
MTSTKIKYSIIIPTLNGYKTLSKTLPVMLKCTRKDVQWVISDNRSDDELFDFVQNINDPRVTLVRPNQRLQVGAHLDFGYTFAVGEWQSHLGDDDIIFESRFAILDEIIKRVQDVDLIKGGLARYYWHDFPIKKLANTLSPGMKYTGKVRVYNGDCYGRELLNTKTIAGGGSWVVRADVISKIRRKYGYFSTFHTVEFYTSRMSAFHSRKVVEIDAPIWIAGRHSGSVGSQAFIVEDKVKSVDWDWEFERPDPHAYCPYDYNGYIPISLDAALQVASELDSSAHTYTISREYWADAVLSETERLICSRKLPASYRVMRDKVIAAEVGLNRKLKLRSFLYKIYNKMPELVRKVFMWFRRRSRTLETESFLFGWSDGDKASNLYGAENISELSLAIDRENCDQIFQIIEHIAQRITVSKYE